MRFLCSILILLSFHIEAAQWGVGYGGTGSDAGRAITTDGSGNVFVTGWFTGSFSFGGTTLTSAGGLDVFIAKLNASGVLQWVKGYGGSGTEVVTCIALDPSGNIFIGGNFSGTANLGGTNMVSAGGQDMFIAKYDTSGNFVWEKAFGDTLDDVVNAITADSSGNVIATGYFEGGVDFGAGTIFATFGGPDTFLLKLSSASAYVWNKTFTNFADDRGTGVAVDGSDNVIICGYFLGTQLDLGGGPLANKGASDGYLGKFNSAGTFLWSTNAAGTGTDQCVGVKTDSGGNVYLLGFFTSAATIGGTSLTTAGGWDTFLAKFNSSGAGVWAKSFASPGNFDLPVALSVDASGNSAIVGHFTSTINLGGGSLSAPVLGTQTIFSSKYNSSGSFLWAQITGSSGADFGSGIALSSGNANITGSFAGTGTFGGQALTSAGSDDIFVMQFGQGVNWYVAKEAVGLNNGTSYANAWNEMSNVVWASVQPGDVINISGNIAGTTNYYFSFLSQNIGSPNSGTQANPITIRLDPARPGTINLFGGIYINRDWYTLDFRYNQNYTPVTTIDTLNTTRTNCALRIYQQQNGNHGVNYASGIGQTMHGIWVVQNGNASAIGGGTDYNALEINGNSGGRLITNCDIAYNVLGEAYGFGFEATGFAGRNFNLLRFHHNIIEFSHDNYMQADGFLRFDHNVCWKWQTPGIGHPDFMQGISAYTIIDHNILMDNPGTGFYIEANDAFGWENSYIYDNLIFSSTQSWHDGITLTGHDSAITNRMIVTNIWVMNNTFGDANGASVWVQNNGTTRQGGGMTNVHFLNNAIAFQFPTNGTQPVLQFYTNTSDINGVTGLTYAQSDVEVDYNNISVGSNLAQGIYYSGQGNMQGTPYTNFTDFGLRTAYKHNTNGAATYVSLTNFDFRVGADLGLKGLGTNLISTLTTNICPDIDTDLIGSARPTSGAIDIGAYQSDPTLKMWLTFHNWGGQGRIAADDSGFTNNAVPFSDITNCPTIGIGQDGKIAAQWTGKYLWPGPPAEQGGSIQYFAITNLSGGIDNVTNGSILFWAWEQTNSSRISAILDSGYPDTDGSWFIGREFDNQTDLRLWTNSTIINAGVWFDQITLDVDGYQTEVGSWKHYGVTWTNQSGTMHYVFFKNGSTVFTNDIGNFQSMKIGGQLTTPVYLGLGLRKHQMGPSLDPLHQDSPNAGWYGGAMDDMRFYTRTLSYADVAAIASGSGISGSVPAGGGSSNGTNLIRVTNLRVGNTHVGP